MAPATSAREPRRRKLEGLLALVGFVLLSVALYGRSVVTHPATVFAGLGFGPGRDQAQITWCLAWVAHALQSGANPFFSDVVYVPHGFPLGWAPSLTGPGILLSPLTLAAGPVVTFNLLAVTAPGIAAWTAYLLCRELSPAASPWPALAGGLLFGFGSYETVETNGHMNLALVGLVPLAALFVLLRARGRLSSAGFIGLLGVTLGLQVYTSTEILATGVMFGALALVVWWAVERSPQVPRVALECGLALAVAALIGLPLLVELARHSFPLREIYGGGVGIDAANLLAPTSATLLPDFGSLFINTSSVHGLAVNPTESVGFVGVPLLVLLGLYFWQGRRSSAARILFVVALAAVIFALGEKLLFAGHITSIPLPWLLVSQLPLYGKVIAARMMLYFWLAAAAATALWLTDSAPWRLALFALVCITLIPSSPTRRDYTPVGKARLVNDPALLAKTVPAGSTVLALPWGIHGNSMLWQFQSEFHYRMAGGYLGPTPALEYSRYPNLLRAFGNQRFKSGPLKYELCSFLHLTDARRALVRGMHRARSDYIFGTIGATPRLVGGFRVYDLGAAFAPAGPCSAFPALRTGG